MSGRYTFKVFSTITFLFFLITGQVSAAPGITLEDAPNLTPSTPPGWEGPLTAAQSQNTFTTDSLTAFVDTYIDWAIINTGSDITSLFKTCIYYDDFELQCWNNSDLKNGEFFIQTDWIMTYPSLEGTHRLELRADVENVIKEGNENDNSISIDFNWSANTAINDLFEAGLSGNDAFLPPDVSDFQKNLTLSQTPGWVDTSAFMTNTVAVAVVFPESINSGYSGCTGGTENWTSAEINTALSNVQAALNWWQDRARSYMVYLSFQITFTPIVNVSYEPINCKVGFPDKVDTQEGLWISDIMTQYGYRDATYSAQVRSFDNDLRNEINADWAFTIFMVDASNDSDGEFVDYDPNSGSGASTKGFAYLGGPYMVVSNRAAPISNTVAHELGHIFYAADQYGNCSTSRSYGYLGILNSNCRGSTNNIMRDSYPALHWTTAYQVGWRDSNNNGFVDPLDTTPSITVDTYPTPSALVPLTYLGHVADIPYPHFVCLAFPDEIPCPLNDINLNRINSMSFQIDNGAWNSVTATDGAFNSDYENFRFTTPVLSPGSHHIILEAVSNVNVRQWDGWISIPNPPPATPSSVSASNGIYTDRVNVAWGSISGASSYEIWRNSANTTSGAVKLAVDTASPYDDGNASIGTLYYYWVKACSSVGCSDFSAVNSGYRGQTNVVIVNPPVLTPSYSGDMCGSAWYKIPGHQGYNDAPAYITLNTNNPAKATNSGIWQPNLPAVGTYQVEAFVVTHNPVDWLCPTLHIGWDTSQANYTITHANGTTTVTGNQAPLNNQWLNLGSFVFNSGTAGKVKLVDLNGESALSRTISFSAMRFTFQGSVTFFDVPTSNWAYSYIERLYKSGITTGCGGGYYCPTSSVTRAQMAIFLLRGIHGSSYAPPAASGTRFSDVPLGSFGAAWIEQLAAEGITTGCGNGKYCPNQTVTRAQMAVFLIRARHGVAFIPPAAKGIFSDVSTGSFGANYIEQLSVDGITSGCGGSNFCPNTTVNRDSMAVFLVKAFALP